MWELMVLPAPLAIDLISTQVKEVLEGVCVHVWPWWLRWRELLCPAAGWPSQRVLPGLPGVEGWLPAWSECWSLHRIAAALMQCSSGSFWLQCVEECSHSGEGGRWTVTGYNNNSVWVPTIHPIDFNQSLKQLAFMFFPVQLKSKNISGFDISSQKSNGFLVSVASSWYSITTVK